MALMFSLREIPYFDAASERIYVKEQYLRFRSSAHSSTKLFPKQEKGKQHVK